MITNLAKTKILATLGPATDTLDKMGALVEAGVDAFRLNFSHSNNEAFHKIFNLINEVSVKQSLPIATLIDLQGPKIRVGELKKKEIEIKTGDSIKIKCTDFLGTQKEISCSYSDLVKDAQIGDSILIDDGLIKLIVSDKSADAVICDIIEGGILRPKKGMNLPGMKLSTPALSEKDYKNLEFALNYRVDFIALSFVRSSNDILTLKHWLAERNKNTPIIAKIEKPEAVDKFEKILDISDGIMIARGDLGVELKPQQVPLIQKELIKKCNNAGKLVITATQMLESMVHNPIPTRAEASDVANAVLDGTDVVMLSAETSVGKYPVEAVRMMNDILVQTEKYLPKKSCHQFSVPYSLTDNLFDSTGKAISCIADQISASLIVVFTHQGRKAKVISKFKPAAPIIAVSDSFGTLNHLNLHWGIYSYFLDHIDNEEYAIEKASEILKKNNLVKKGNVVLFTAGAPYTEEDRKTWLRFIVF